MPYWVCWLSGSSGESAMPVVKQTPLGEKPAWRRNQELVGNFANKDLAMQLAYDMVTFQITMLGVRGGWARYWAASPAERAQMVETAVEAAEERDRFQGRPRMTVRRQVF